MLGDLLCDIEIGNGGDWNGTCPENEKVILFKGGKVGVYAGGAGNVSCICTENHATTSLWCDGPGQKDKAWVGELVKRVLRCSRVYWSGEGAISLKLRGLCNNLVVSRIDADEITQRKHPFVALEALADDCDRYNAIIVSDYCKGLVCPETEVAIGKIIKNSKVSVIDSKRLDYSLWRGATALVPNANEAARIYSTIDPMEIVQKAGVQACFITRGNNSVLFSDGKINSEIELEKDIQNPYVIGAGDAFAAGVTLALGRGESFMQAGQAGMRLAQQYVSKSRKCQLR